MLNYYISTSKYLGSPQRGTFASKNFKKGEIVAIASEIPRVYERADLDWKLYDFVKMTNHSEDKDNLEPIFDRDKKGTLITHVAAAKPIKKDEEFLLNYKSLPYADKIDLSFLDKDAGKWFLYHHLSEDGLVLFNKHGLCSPRRLYDYDKDLYMDTVHDKYFKKAVEYFDSNNDIKIGVYDTIVLDYLDQVDPGYNTSRTLHFSMIPLEEYNDKYKEKKEYQHEVKIDILKLETAFPKIVIFYGKDREKVNIDILKNTKYISAIKRLANKEPKNEDDDLFERVPYVGLKDSYFISYELFHMYDHGSRVKTS